MFSINLLFKSNPNEVQTIYVFKALTDAGTLLAFGSDWSVAPATPLEGIYAAVTRQTLDGQNQAGWVPEEKITVEQALMAYTKNAAYASFDEKIKRTLEPGKLADLVIMDKNPFEFDPVEIKNIIIKMTIVGGNVYYEND
ncbi:MAG: amidohydrolase family protein [Cyclobacteriaceae bacterium]|nr:amidohydrolase family protein [Cyclobacteriaceae bacterium]